MVSSMRSSTASKASPTFSLTFENAFVEGFFSVADAGESMADTQSVQRLVNMIMNLIDIIRRVVRKGEVP